MPTELKPGIHWVGYVDWNVRDFHSFDTRHGATYNSYLIQDEKTALIDTVKGPFASQLLENLRCLTELEKIDYVVCNHAEPDHASALGEVMKHLPNGTLLCNEKCRNVLKGYFDISGWNIQVVTPNDTVSLGHRTLHFLNTPMVHWPESMFTYLAEEKILFSMDAFGQHMATSVRFDDEWPLHETLLEAKSYYANIVTPYGRQVLQVLDAAKTLDIEMIATSHGLIWRKYLQEILTAYHAWASGKYEPKILILYDSMWESTRMMADAILSGAMDVSPKLNVLPLHVRKNSLTRIATEMLDTAAVAAGSATLNMQMMPAMAAALTYVRGLKFAKKAGFAFGSYGWNSAGANRIQKWFEEMQWETSLAPVNANWRPAPSLLEQCADAGRVLAAKALEMSGQ
ncbi:MAG: FprA family A-type flavoprotein [Planctomycetaceae bacterium]|jgi:flavorubredoxin|nr:FprA family A-type flavoprotein [Planctomycetaceae bacterium]